MAGGDGAGGGVGFGGAGVMAELNKAEFDKVGKLFLHPGGV